MIGTTSLNRKIKSLQKGLCPACGCWPIAPIAGSNEKPDEVTLHCLSCHTDFEIKQTKPWQLIWWLGYPQAITERSETVIKLDYYWYEKDGDRVLVHGTLANEEPKSRVTAIGHTEMLVQFPEFDIDWVNAESLTHVGMMTADEADQVRREVK